jgi:PTH1 family peptidyl-tRNA hydrolase
MEEQAHGRKFLVGLGNPGRQYAATRHNVGWMVLAELRRRWGVESGKGAFGGRLYQTCPPGMQPPAPTVLMLEPLTYMNRSGQAVKGLLAFYKADPSDLLVVMDDMALPPGTIRARAVGSDGGHNGMKDVIAHLGTDQVPRLRLGIGQPPAAMDAVDYVLAAFGEDETPAIARAVAAAADAVEDWLANGIAFVMDKYNSRKDADERP